PEISAVEEPVVMRLQDLSVCRRRKQASSISRIVGEDRARRRMGANPSKRIQILRGDGSSVPAEGRDPESAACGLVGEDWEDGPASVLRVAVESGPEPRSGKPPAFQAESA